MTLARTMTCAGAALALGVAGTGHAQPAAEATVEGPWLWAAPALYGAERSVCTAGSGDAEPTAIIAPAFCPHLTAAGRAAIGQAFAAAVARHFPRVESVFGAHLPHDATPRARLRGTLAASLRLSRASLAVVPKGDSVDAYMPITLTLDMTNMGTGEVVFTRNYSAVANGAYPAQSVEAEVAAQFPGQIAAATEALVAESAAAFRPRVQSAKVLGEVALGKSGEKGWVVDLGRSAGLRSGDSLGLDGQVIHAGSDYAVVQPALEQYRTGQTLARTVLAPAELLARPGVLVVMDSIPQGYAATWLGQILEDALGSAGGLAPIPVNPAFSALRMLALDSAQASLGNDERSLPDYVALVRVALLDPATYPSNLAGVEVDHFEAHVFVSLTDATGRVAGAWQGSATIDDQVNAGVRFAPAQRRDAVVRNALLDVAGKMAAFRPRPQLLPLQSRDGHLVIVDPTGAAPLGATLQVLRPAGRFKGLADTVFVPVGQVSAQETVAGGVAAVDVGLTPLGLRGGEQVVMEAAGNPLRSREVIAQCRDGKGLPLVDDRGTLTMPMWSAAAETVLAHKASVPLHLATLPDRLRPLAPSFAGWERFEAARARVPSTCFAPVLALDPVAGGYGVTVGYALRRAGAKVGASGLRVTLTPTRLPATASAEAVAAMLQADLARQVPPLAEQAAAALNPAP